MPNRIRCAVLGLGRQGFRHAENLAFRVPGAELAAVVDAVEERSRKTAADLGVSRWYTHPEPVFQDPDIDAVIIATPNDTHARLAIEAARHNKAIFVEKPLTTNLNDADQIIEIVEQTGVLCQVGFMRRFDPAYAYAKECIRKGDIGEPVYFKGVTRDPFAPSKEYVRSSGGIFMDMCIHDFDIARFLMDSEVESVTAHGKVLVNDFMKTIGDIDQALTYLTFTSGAAGDVEGYRSAGYGYDIRAEVIGTEGTIVIGSLRRHDVVLLSSKGETRDIVPNFLDRFQEAYLLEMIDFVRRVQNGEPPAVTAGDGKAALLIAQAATRSFREKKTVKVSSEQVT
jgi:scyllo-inositol 2-dehydrogenase (NAD+)